MYSDKRNLGNWVCSIKQGCLCSKTGYEIIILILLVLQTTAADIKYKYYIKKPLKFQS